MEKLKTMVTINTIIVSFVSLVLLQYLIQGTENYSSAIILTSLLSILGLRIFIEERDAIWRKKLIDDVQTIVKAQDAVIVELKETVSKLNTHAIAVNNRLEIKGRVDGKEALQEGLKRRF